MIQIEKLVIVGAGLIGGSFSLALKKAGAVGRVVGVGRRAETLERARQLGVIDAIGGYDADTFGDASLVLIDGVLINTASGEYRQAAEPGAKPQRYYYIYIYTKYRSLRQYSNNDRNRQSVSKHYSSERYYLCRQYWYNNHTNQSCGRNLYLGR